MIRRHAALFAGMSAVIAGAGAMAADVSPGLWETTAEISMPGTPQGAGMNGSAPLRETRCFRASDVQDPQKLIPPDAACHLTTSRQEGNRLSWGMECAGSMAGNGELTFTPTRYEGVFRATGSGVQLTMKYSGKRIGDCQ